MEEETNNNLPTPSEATPQQPSAFPHNNETMGGYSIYSGLNTENFPGMQEDHMMNSLTSDKNIPKHILKKYWWVFSKDLVLSFLDDKGKKMKMLAFDIAKIDYLMTLPYYEYTFEIEQELNNVRNIYDIKTDRAVGTEKPNKINERIAQRSQFAEQRQTIKQDGVQETGNFLRKILSRR